MDVDRNRWRWFFGLAALEAGAAFVVLALLPRQANAVSAARALMLAILAAFFIAGLGSAIRPPRCVALLPRSGVIVAMGLCSLLLAVGLFLLRYLNPPLLLPYYQRLLPLLGYFLLLCGEGTLFLLVLRFGLHRAAVSELAASRKPILIALCALAIVSAFVALTRIGVTPDSAYWGEPGVPIQGWQFALAILAGLAILIAGLAVRIPDRTDLYIGLGMWLLAVLLWLSVPAFATRNSFYAPITPPDNQPYPNSDAGYYDSMAESLLIGQPYQGEIPTRPLYIVGVTGLHLAFGENYGLIIAGQTLLLALIPVVLYFLGKTIHSRAAGLTAALFSILREWTTILVSSQTRVSDSRTLLVDLPTLLLVLVACLLTVRWLARRHEGSAVIVGGLFGLLLLLRTQSLLIAPLLLIIVVLAYGLRNRRWILPVVVFAVALVATAIPWLVHNYLQAGTLTLDAPFQYQIIASQYRYTGNLDISSIDLQGKSVAGILITFLLRDPRFVLGFVATHFLATEMNGLLALPLIEPYAGLTAPVNLYWLDWTGQLAALNLVLILVYLAVIAVGLATSWQKLRWAGLVPLVFSLGYALANGIGRFSGWRYDLPADWISYFYFAIGAAQLLGFAALLFGAIPARLFTATASPLASRLRPSATAFMVAGFVLVGSLPWMAQGLASPRYLDQDSAHLAGILGASPALSRTGLIPAQVESFAASPGAAVESGRVLYPRFFSRNLGLASAHPWPAYAPRDFPRLGFLLLNQTRSDVVFPSRQLTGPFPQAADAIVLGCQREGYIEARLVLFPGSNLIYASTPFDQPCR